MSCISRTELDGLIGGTLAPEARRALVGHLADCPLCRRRWSDHCLAAELAAGPPELAPGFLKARAKALVRRNGPGALRWRGSLAVAASLLLTAGLGWWAAQRRDAGPRPEAELLRDAPLEVMRPRLAETLGRGRGGSLELTWSTVGEAQDYLLTIADERGDVVHEERVRETAGTGAASAAVDPAAEGLASGRTYVWFVTARFPDGTEIDSEIRSFVLDDGDP